MTQPQEEVIITVNNKNYPISSLPTEIKDLIAVYQLWENEIVVQRREVFKSEAAMRALSGEIEARLKVVEASAMAETNGVAGEGGTPKKSSRSSKVTLKSL